MAVDELFDDTHALCGRRTPPTVPELATSESIGRCVELVTLSAAFALTLSCDESRTLEQRLCRAMVV